MIGKYVHGITKTEILFLIFAIVGSAALVFYLNYAAYNQYKESIIVKNTSYFANPDKLKDFKGEIKQDWLDDEVHLLVNISYGEMDHPFASVNPYYNMNKDGERGIEIIFEVPEKFKNNIEYARAHQKFLNEKLKTYKFFYEDLKDKELIDELEKFNKDYLEYVKDIKIENNKRDVLSLKNYR